MEPYEKVSLWAYLLLICGTLCSLADSSFNGTGLSSESQQTDEKSLESLDDFKYDRISLSNLTLPKSIVTPEIDKDLDELNNKLKEHEYYAQKLQYILNDYPVKLENEFVQTASTLLKKMDYLNLLIFTGFTNCSHEPIKCKDFIIILQLRICDF